MCAPSTSIRKKTVRAGLLFVCAVLFAVGFTYAGEDWQYWSTWKASYKVSENASINFLGEGYFKDNMSEDYLYDEYLGMTYSLGHGFQALAFVQHVSAKNNAGDWNSTWKAVPGLSYSMAIPRVGKLKLQDRLYYKVDPECEWDHHRPRLYLIRNIGPVKLTLSDELRLDLSGEREDDFYRNRVQVAVSQKLTDHLSLALAYVRQSDRKGREWESFNVLQTVVSLSF